jgi:hypothetical protein
MATPTGFEPVEHAHRHPNGDGVLHGFHALALLADPLRSPSIPAQPGQVGNRCPPGTTRSLVWRTLGNPADLRPRNRHRCAGTCGNRSALVVTDSGGDSCPE